ncbi:MAG: WD40/YVTN/BNR-like repeat-containing protein [Rhodanobacteraceae bacterium]
MPNCRFNALLAAAALVACALVAPVATAAPSQSISPFVGDLHWRLLGPFRGGWSTMAEGIPDRPNVYYFVGAGSGVWKTDNAGRTWISLGDKLGASAMGAMAISPSNPKVIYIGSGQVAARWDIQSGNGVYKTTDGGKNWTHVGLADSKYTGRILVDPKDANTVLVGALGHYFGPNHERGVFRSTDGGETWRQTLFINPNTGVVDLARDPEHPDVVFAAAWQIRKHPWMAYFQHDAGPCSGLYKSSDDGVTWQRLSGNGWPAGVLGRIGLATGRGGVVYAVVNAVNPGEGGLYRSGDDGAHWEQVSSAGWLPNDYFTRITVDPANANVVYAAGQSIRRSTDGGKTWRVFKGAPGGDDYHFVWINPLHPGHMIAAVDQGTTVTVDGGKTWSSWYNQPTAQVYHLAADNQFQYWVYSGQQDSGTIGIASRSDYGAITYRDWHPVGGDERDYDVPDPNDPMIVYGSGLGGRVSRFNARTGQVANVSPWPIMSYGARPENAKYRYTWITPLVATKDKTGGTELLFGAQLLFRSLDRGEHWKVISPDLTGQRQNAQGCTKHVSVADARACGYGVIYSIAVAPNDADEIWTGSDSGMIYDTRDGGAHWNDVTPRGIPTMTKISSLDVSALMPCTVYAAADNHRDNDYSPHVWRTHDCGKTWQEVDNGLPKDHYVSVVRADTVRKDLLYAGTDAGVYVSFDDGGRWQPLQLNLPTAWVRDLLVHGDDLIAATQGRAIWVLDDITPLRQYGTKVTHAGAYLFKPADAVRVHPDNNKDTPLPPGTPEGENPPAGAIIDYGLAPNAHGPVSIDILDATGKTVRHYESNATHRKLDAFRYFTKEWWTGPPVNPPATPGLHRFVWDLHYARPRSPSYAYSIAAVFGKDTPILPEGPFVLPGKYTVVLKADGETLKQPLTVTMDPRVDTSMADLQDALAFSQQVDAALSQAAVGAAQQKAVAAQLDNMATKLAPDKAHAGLLTDIHAVQAKLRTPENAKLDASASFEACGGILAGVESDMESADVAPNQGQREVLENCNRRLQQAQSDWQMLQGDELAKLDADLKTAGLPGIVVPLPGDLVMPAKAENGADLP